MDVGRFVMLSVERDREANSFAVEASLPKNCSFLQSSGGMETCWRVLRRLLRGLNESAEDGARGFVFIHRTLRMPLHTQHEVIG